MNQEQMERLKKVALVAVPTVLGAVAVKNVREASLTKHISYWEASQSFIIDLIHDGRSKSTRLSGRVLHGALGRHEVEDIEIDGFEYTEDDVAELEENFKIKDLD